MLGKRLVERGFAVDLFALGGNAAARALAGEPILIMPLGTFHRDGSTFTVDGATVAEFVANWEHRAERGIRRTRLAVDTDHNGRAVGWYAGVMPLDLGLGATFAWTAAGRQALESEEFAYFSPTVYWQLQDPVTGELVRNQIGGGALTNYPFFGEQTALYCADAAPVYFAVTKTEGGEQYPARAYLVVEDAEKPSTWHLRVYSWQDGELKPDHGLMGAAKAALTSPGGYRGNKYEGPQRDEAVRKLRALYESEGMEFKSKGGSVMAMDNDQGVNDAPPVTDTGWAQFGRWVASFLPAIPAGRVEHGDGDGDGGGAGDGDDALRDQVAELVTQFNNLKTQMDAVAAERDTYKSQVEALQSDLGRVQDERESERFATMAQAFAHLPVEVQELAGHLRWLYSADVALTEGDDAGKQVHAEFFFNLLRRADEEFAQAFGERGHNRVLGGGAMAAIESAISEYRKAHPEAVEYSVALDAVLAANPDLFAAYEAAREGGV